MLTSQPRLLFPCFKKIQISEIIFRNAHAVSCMQTCFSLLRPSLNPRLDHVGYVLGKAALRQNFSENFGLPWQFSLHQSFRFSHTSPSAGRTDHIQPKWHGTQSHPTLRIIIGVSLNVKFYYTTFVRIFVSLIRISFRALFAVKCCVGARR